MRSYALKSIRALQSAGYDAVLLRAPAWRGAPWSLARYGEVLAADLERRGERVDLLVGLSVGTQAAAIATIRTDLVRQLLLVSPMVDPVRRTHLRLLHRWFLGPSEIGDPPVREQVPDWLRAGLVRLVLGFHSAVVTMPLERILPRLSVPVTIVHAGHDELGRWSWAQRLADDCGGRALLLPGQAHSWPVHDPGGFVGLVGQLTAEKEQS